MAHTLLHEWLSLPPGDWPPDHYTLLDTAPSAVTAAEVETRVLKRMDLLRQHQLRHPDLVTEGMNRLAQALICLSDPNARSAYDAERITKAIPVGSQPPPPIPPATFPENEPQSPSPKVKAPGRVKDSLKKRSPIKGDRTQVVEQMYEAELEPPPMMPNDGVRVVKWVAEVGSASQELPYEVVPESELIAAGDMPVAELRTETITPSPRWVYARLAVLRRTVRQWQDLKTSLGNPDEFLDSPARVILFLEALAALRPILPAVHGIVGPVGTVGGSVVAIVNQTFPLHTVRNLLPDQRQSVALDWKRGLAALKKEYDRLRTETQAQRSRPGRVRKRAMTRCLMRLPEVILYLLFASALVITIVRSVRR